MGNRVNAMKSAARDGRGKGSHATRAASDRALRDLNQYMKDQGHGGTKPEHVKPPVVRQYIADRIAAGESPGTTKNRMTHIRAMWRGCGRGTWADQVTNKTLGIPERDRTGQKVALSSERYQSAIAEMQDRGEHRVAAILKLQYEMGLRLEEAIEGTGADGSLQTWERALSDDSAKVPVTLGTKGHRSRDVRVPDRTAVRAAVQEARDLAGEGNLVEGKGGDLLSARQHVEYIYQQAGLTGESSSHAARYAYAQRLSAQYRDQGLTEREALIRVTHDLGHGDSRGRWAKSVYLR